MRYRLYHLQDYRLTGADEVEAADDAEATILARQRTSVGTTEVWRGSRRVRTIGPALAPRT